MNSNKLILFFNYHSILLILIFVPAFCLSQNQTNNWYFGNNAGLNFSNGDVVVVENGGMQTPAGCATISDNDGNLLFYTNGQTVWNSNHQVMENGDGLFGQASGNQSSIIIPKPNDPNTYYIFHTREVVETSPIYYIAGIYYSEVKFTAQHPLGHITDNKNLRIAEVSSTTRLAAIHHPETNTTRVVCITKQDPVFGIIIPDGKYIFRIFNVTQSGINTTPIKREINENLGTLGAMKISPDGNFLAFADDINQKIYFYNFDNDVVNFTPYFTMQAIPAFQIFLNPYGIEFSQDSKMFYYTGGNYVVQFPFTAINDPIPFEYYLMPVSNPGSIQLARNGRIYVAQGTSDNSIAHLAVINYPERVGADCNFQSSAIQFTDATSTRGLPLFIASELRNRIIPSEDDCVDKPFTFELDAYADIQSVLWDFGDGTSSTESSPTHLFSTGGIKTVKATIIINNQPIVLYKKVEAYPLPFLPPNQILTQCDIDNDGESVFNLENIKDFVSDGAEFIYTFYKNSDDANDDTNPIQNQQFYTNISNPEEIFVKMLTPFGCTSIASFQLENYSPNTQPIKDYFACENSDNILNNFEGKFNLGNIEIEIRNEFGLSPDFTVNFFSSLIDAQTKINPLGRYYTGVSTIIWVRIEDENFNCFGVIPFNAVVNSNISVDIESVYTICDPSLHPTIILDGGISNDTWTWKNQSGAIISTQRLFQLLQVGSYSVTVEKVENGLTCSVKKNFIVKGITNPEFLDVKAEDGEIYVSIKGNSTYEFSLDGVSYVGLGTSYTFGGVRAGVQTVYVKDINNCEKIISVEVYLLNIPNYFTPNNDSYNDIWKIAGLSDQFYTKAEILIFDRYSKLLHKMNLYENEVGWDGIYNNQTLPASDYWYKVTLTDLQNNLIVKRGHFSLLR
ncbi:T9SS type B sorting domain-containing protein [Flavobacterium sp. SM2513]|uniref:T9SS type B sorting domain-containing protein n=1 Tax=Flavobacterium sp. SM2513 TaxID=3424766 RepID=UPI003D7FFE59